MAPQEVPSVLDYDRWLGPAPFKPYHPHRVHGTFRGYWDYDGGGLGDMGMHYLDPVQYLLQKDDTSPVRIEADCPQQHPDACSSWRRIELDYADGCKIILDGENAWDWYKHDGKEFFRMKWTTNYDVNSIDKFEYLTGPTLANPDIPVNPNPNFGRYRHTPVRYFVDWSALQHN